MKNCYRALVYSISKIWKINLGNITAVVYILCVFGQMLLLGKKFRVFDLLQIPMSIVISQIINFFNDIITISNNNFMANFILLIIAIMLTGIGVVMTVQMRFVPNAADGFTQAVSRRAGISLGTLAAVFGVGRSIALVNKLFKNKMLALVE